jgi:hypothetical protein
MTQYSAAGSVPQIPDTYDVLGAALLLVKHGFYVLPVEPDTKRPARFLRKDWPAKTSNDPEQVKEWFSGGEYALAIHVGRSGLIAFDVDHFENLPDQLLNEFKNNPGPWQSTRGEGLRGHRVYAIPPGYIFGNSLGSLKTDPEWGEVRGSNGIIVVEPSNHTKPGGRYKWMAPGPIPTLSCGTADCLPKLSQDEADARAATDVEVKAFLDAHTSNDRPQFLPPIIEKFGVEANSGSRHEAMVRNLCWAMREAAMGFFPARDAALQIREIFLLMFNPELDKGRFPKPEFWGGLAFAVSQAKLIDVEERKAKLNERLSERDKQTGWDKRSTPSTAEATPDQAAEPERGEGFYTGAKNGEGKTRINVGDTARVMPWLREEMGRGALSGLFLRDMNLVYTPLVGEDGYVKPKKDGEDDGPAQVRVLSESGLVSMFETRYDIGKVEIDKKTEEHKWRNALFPASLSKRCLGSAEVGDAPNLRVLHGVTHTPVMRSDGSIVDTPGYDTVTGMLYLPDGTMGQVVVPENPSARQVREARDTVMYPVGEFPFVSNDDLANWVGAAFTPLLRPLVPPPYQFLVIEAPSPGSGKGYLLGVLREAHGVALRPGMPGKDEEWSKVVMTMLAGTTAPIVAFDNVRGTIRSAVLEGLLTTKTVSDRMLGKNTEYMQFSNDRLWAMTGNNAQLGGDLARRTLRVTIDPRVPNPEARDGFRCHPVLWTRSHRAEYISALLTIARGWVVAGRPTPNVKRSDDYASWVRTIRGIMTFAGFVGTFSNSERRQERAVEDEDWEAFLTAVVDSFGVKTEFTARELYAQIEGNRYGKPDGIPIDPQLLPGDLPDKFGKWSDEGRFLKSLGFWLKNRVGRYAGDLKVVDRGKGKGERKNIQIYWIERAGSDRIL